MQRRLTTQDITWFIDINGLGRLDLEPSYQRRSVWTRRDRQFFLDTVFNNYPSPAIFLHKDLDEFGNATYHVVDGKQRLETILLFLDNKLSIREDFGDARLGGKKWKDLRDDMEVKKRLLDYQVTVEMIDSIEPTVVNEVFGRLNQNSRKLTAQEIRHARFDGWFINRAEQEAENLLWKSLKVSTPGRYRRMQDIQYIAELMAIILEQRILGFDQAGLDELFAKYDYPEDLDTDFNVDEFETVFESRKQYLRAMEDESGLVVNRYAKNLAHFYTLWAWVALTEDLPEPSIFGKNYATFMDAVQAYVTGEEDTTTPEGSLEAAARKYAEASRGATTDLSLRTARFDALSAGLKHLAHP